ncbi:MAG: hypothetical protein Q7S26_00635 [bacterium]|nr:hypothetical protein [bacterium]
MAETPMRVEINGSLEGHGHLRDDNEHGDGRMELVTDLITNEHGFPQHEVVLAMGNTSPPITTPEQGKEYKARSRQHLGLNVDVLVAMMGSDTTTVNQILEGYDRPAEERWIDALKIFQRGVSNDEGASISSVDAILPLLEELDRREIKIPILWHAERLIDDKGKQIPILEREDYAVARDIDKVVRTCDASITIEHASSRHTVAYVRNRWREGKKIYAGIAPQYFVRTHDDLFRNARFHSHELCWPIYKDEASQMTIILAALSGEECFYFGSDIACHIDDMTRPNGVKITSHGEVCGGLSQTPATAKSLVIEAFEDAALLDTWKLNAFLSGNGMARFGRTAKAKTVYERRDWQVPEEIEWETAHGKHHVVPFLGGSTRRWQRVA